MYVRAVCTSIAPLVFGVYASCTSPPSCLFLSLVHCLHALQYDRSRTVNFVAFDSSSLFAPSPLSQPCLSHPLQTHSLSGSTSPLNKGLPAPVESLYTFAGAIRYQTSYNSFMLAAHRSKSIVEQVRPWVCEREKLEGGQGREPLTHARTRAHTHTQGNIRQEMALARAAAYAQACCCCC